MVAGDSCGGGEWRDEEKAQRRSYKFSPADEEGRLLLFVDTIAWAVSKIAIAKHHTV